MRFGDPLDDFDRRDRELEQQLLRRPLCGYCNQHIQSDRCMDIEGECYHVHCAIKRFGRDTEEFM